jgi:thiol-disulfide isomerase/thioredoxin
MKSRIALAALLALSILTFPATPANAAGDPEAQLNELVGKINEKLQNDQRTESALADELKQFDALLAEHKDSKSQEVAQILFMKATLYSQVLGEEEKGLALLKQLTTDFPGTPQADYATSMIKTAEIQAKLGVGKPFPDFDVKDINEQPLSLAKFKGKTVLIDFWATWCGPCVAELPNVLKAYEQYHDKGFEIIGISLDQDKDKLTSFIKQRKMNWPQFFDGQGWQNSLAQEYGINSIPATYLVDGKGNIIGKNLRGEALVEAVAKAVGQ